MSEEEAWPLDLKELLPLEASVVSSAHCEPNCPTEPSSVHSEAIVAASKSSSYPAEGSVTKYSPVCESQPSPQQ